MARNSAPMEGQLALQLFDEVHPLLRPAPVDAPVEFAHDDRQSIHDLARAFFQTVMTGEIIDRVPEEIADDVEAYREGTVHVLGELSARQVFGDIGVADVYKLLGIKGKQEDLEDAAKVMNQHLDEFSDFVGTITEVFIEDERVAGRDHHTRFEYAHAETTTIGVLRSAFALHRSGAVQEELLHA